MGSVIDRLIVGLGNPGEEYRLTRHNLGLLAIQALAAKHRWKFKEASRYFGRLAKGSIDGKSVHLLFPTTYMNLSGQAVGKYVGFYKIPPQQLLVAVDDVEIPFGEIRLKPQGSPGGHNGLKSIEEALGTKEYPRLRLGVGEGAASRSRAEYVLDKFMPVELEALPTFIERAVVALEQWVTLGISATMNNANKK